MSLVVLERLKTRIAKAEPFVGAPAIHLPAVIGASANKPILYRIPVTGQRPIVYGAENLPTGLALTDNCITGTVAEEGAYTFVLTAKNALGECRRVVTLEIAEGNVLVTPLLGYTTWNAFAADVTQKDVEGIADRLVELGLTEYGYSYVNTDSGWQGEYGGALDAIQPNKKFPDMKAMTDKIHAYGLKCGIYSTPMLTAWGCPGDMESIPGCTQGEPDPRFPSTNGGIGTVRKEANNARQWAAWGFDYLKYDWGPVTDPVNAEQMRQELARQDRDFGFCVTVRAIREYGEYWSKYCSSYRCNPDTYANWPNLVEVYESYFAFADCVCKGHYFDLDMLDFGTCRLHTLWHALTDDEKILEFSMRAFLGSPIQISSTLENVTDLELSIYGNPEILAIHQDCSFHTPKLLVRVKEGERYFDVLEKELANGAYAYALFNMGTAEEGLTLFADVPCAVRDAWAREDLAHANTLSLGVLPHTARILVAERRLSLAEEATLPVTPA